MARRSDINWPQIEMEFRCGLTSVRALARKHGIAESNLRLRANRLGWTRTDGELARATAQAAASDAAVARAREIGTEIGAKQVQRMEQEMHEVAYTAAEVLLDHRRASRAAMRQVMDLLDQLQLSSDMQGLVAAAAQAAKADDPARAALIERLLGIRGRVESFDKWTSAFARLVATERAAYDAAEEGKRDSIDEILIRLAKERAAGKEH